MTEHIDQRQEVRQYIIGYNDTERCVIEFHQIDFGWQVYKSENGERELIAKLFHNYDPKVYGLHVIKVEPSWEIAEQFFYAYHKHENA